MDMESISGRMVRCMKVLGKTTEQMEKELSGIIQETSISESLIKIKHKASEYTFMKTEADMKENGTRICSMGKEKKFGMMVPIMSETTKKA